MAVHQAGYLRGFQIKPYEINPLGEVLFTNGTVNDLVPNRQQCEDYGYTYDVASGTCRLNQIRTDKIQQNFQTRNMQISGNNNTASIGSLYGIMCGTDNEINGNAKNNLVVGRDNFIANGVDNVVVFGVNNKVTRQGEFGIGGGQNQTTYDCGEEGGTGSVYADKKMSIIQLSGATCNAAVLDLTVNGESGNFITVKNNSILGYEIHTTRLELGGTAGTAGNYTYMHSQGCVQVDNTYTMTFSSLATRNINSIGGNHGSVAMQDTSVSAFPEDIKSFSVRVHDRVNVVNQWSCVVYLHELISTNVTF